MSALTQISAQYITAIAIYSALAPVFTFLLIGFWGAKAKKMSQFFALTFIASSFLGAVVLFFSLWLKPMLSWQITWFVVGNYTFSIGILLNNLSVLMLLLVSFIALLVHIYSIAYMKNDDRLHRYWAYLGLFCASMMALVIADNLLLIYFFWELVGFSSYLLIGFWYKKQGAIKAAKKAFLINRIGDLGLLFGIMIIFAQFKTFNLEALFGQNGLINSSVITAQYWATPVGILPASWLTICGLCFCLAAMAKSAQFPLHIWLPDAMEGPTSVSSLIHAATMVAAGIFLLVRVNPIFDHFTLNFIAVIGVFTAFMAATIALTQTDLKKILAYSTISQLGFMMFAIGIEAYSTAIFHLFTHAFFKCLLFLAAGSVIHQLHHLKEKHQLIFDEQDINNIGGLKKQMPYTFALMLIAAAALAGLPLTSGYLSKDAILVTAFEWASVGVSARYFLPVLATITSWLTVFYIFRLLFKVFYGDFKFADHLNSIKESGKLMIWPMIVLGAGCLSVFYGFNPLDPDAAWPMQVIGLKPQNAHEGFFHTFVPLYVNILSVLLIIAAYFIYVKKTFQTASKTGFLYLFLQNGWYVDKAYNKIIVASSLKISKFCFWVDKQVIDRLILIFADIVKQMSTLIYWFDKYILDAFIHWLSSGVGFVGNIFRSFQSGKLQHYLMAVLLVFITCYLLNLFL